jgi:OOP family OmpA-OmpF porin
MKLRSALMIATFLTAPVVAMAQPVTGLYVAGGVGGTYLLDDKAPVTTAGGTVASGKLKSRGGFGTVGSVGYGLGNGLRLELEGNYLQQATRYKNAPGAFGGGQLSSYGASINALYDFNIGSAFVPFVGIGGGYQFSQFDSFKVYNGGSTSVFTPTTNSKGGGVANAMFGVAYNVPGAPGLAVTGEYRFSAQFSNPKFGGTLATAGAPTVSASMKPQNMYNNTLLIGLRYAFNAPQPAAAPMPAPAPVVAPAPAVARSYLVFFDWDKSDLNARAQQIIAEAAQASTRVAATRIEVSGYADRTGTAAYNQALSMRRANNVAAELVRLGVAKTAISISAYGDTRPLVPTGPNTREPQNRRVEIVLK